MNLSEKIQLLKDAMYNSNSILGFAPTDSKLFKYSFLISNNSDVFSDCVIPIKNFKEACSVVKILVTDADTSKIEKVLKPNEFNETSDLYLHLFKVVPLP